MPDGAPTFSAAEYERRWRAIQSEMAMRGQDAILLTSAADVFYVTGFLTRFWESPARPWFVILPSAGAPLAVIPDIGRDLMQGCQVGEIRSWPAPRPGDDGVSLLADTLSDLLPETGTIGLPMGPETSLRMPLADYLVLTRALAPRRFVDATDTVQRVREIKSDVEIDAIRATCRCADAAFDRVPEIVVGAGRLDEVFRRFQIALLEEGADWVSYVAGGAGPGGYGNVIAPAEAAPLRDGDLLMLDTGAVKDGYFCDFDRNYAIGRADDDLRRVYDGLYRATEAALSALRPGMTARDAHELLTAGLRRAGLVSAGGRLGHGLGVTLTEWPSFTSLDETPLRENMVLTLEPGAVVSEGRIMVHEEDVVLRAGGPELLSRRAPPELPVIRR
ncbi:metallopeptidase, family M24 [Pseudooceanicola batsensis HTCC2597]|uniref:Metallopeptidase, family M24 n=1 Tax=Pseudooceanicola batsensis (strain ATCC BAA-863 / DSM 15984 / KCTC 12145 / HTCC2597) TaxID=252305 RepID=A3TVD5_PSEBH|nr:Xaa-Pro peptidase family protein [Pseudooceanicola batsensis]EAQ04481.1 metallopeptidase, family M24 [Pseudooceanicola batsensis HTCC2597]